MTTLISTSFVKPIYSEVQVKLPAQTKNLEVNSHILNISSNIERSVATLISLEGYVSPVNSTVITEFKSGNKEVREVSSFVDELRSNINLKVYRQPVQVERTIHTISRQIHANVDVSTERVYIPIQAYVNSCEQSLNGLYES